MSEKEKTILIVIIAFICLAGCLMISCCAGSLLLVSRADRNTVIDLLNNTDLSERNGQNTAPVITQNDWESGDENGLSRAEQLIIAATEKTRGLSAETSLAPVYQTEAELREYMIDQLKDVTDDELEDELGLYTILGFTPKDFDLRQFYVDMYTEQIAGFYDPEENRMHLIEDDSAYNNAVTLAHEYTHYLQYNHPDFKEILNHDDDFCDENGETCVILDALIEGDATLTESLTDVDSVIGSYKDNAGSSAAESSVFDNAPKFFQDSLLFPYMYGYDFAAYHYMKGGFDQVNDLYINLPQSVEQIMHPEKYLIDLPVNVTLEPFRSMIIDADFDVVQEDVLNESDIKMILSSGYDPEWQLSERQASAGADGWGGGSFLYAEKDEKPLFFSKIVWDSVKESEEAEKAFIMYLDKRFGKTVGENTWVGEEDASVCLIRQDDVLYWIILPDNFSSAQLLNLIQNGSSL